MLNTDVHDYFVPVQVFSVRQRLRPSMLYCNKTFIFSIGHRLLKNDDDDVVSEYTRCEYEEARR